MSMNSQEGSFLGHSHRMLGAGLTSLAYFPLQIPGEVLAVFGLQLGSAPVLPIDDAATRLPATVALHLAGLVVEHGVVDAASMV
jgi:hypothetical protein